MFCTSETRFLSPIFVKCHRAGSSHDITISSRSWYRAFKQVLWKDGFTRQNYVMETLFRFLPFRRQRHWKRRPRSLTETGYISTGWHDHRRRNRDWTHLRCGSTLETTTSGPSSNQPISTRVFDMGVPNASAATPSHRSWSSTCAQTNRPARYRTKPRSHTLRDL